MDLPTWSITLIGSIAGICTTGAFLPQAIRVWRLKRADEISLVTFAVLSLGSAIWLFYGILVLSWPIMFANAVTLVLALTIVVLKVKWDAKSSASTSY
jgi:MtN3 and saliva related transmembrane protein